MIRVFGCIVYGHDLWLVVVAGLVCVLASHSSFSLLYRAERQQSRRQYLWLAAAAAAMGSGVWATHFVAMLAFRTPLPIGYDLTLTVLSAAIAVGASGIGLWLAFTGRRLLGGAVAGAAIGMMHFTGMAALKGSFQIEWNPAYVVASLLIGIALSTLAFHLLPRTKATKGHLLVVNIFVLAICSLHFTAMTAATLSLDPFADPAGTSTLERQSMAIAVAAVAALLLSAGLLSAVIDSYLADRNALEAERLRRYISKLEITQSELQETTKNLSLALEAAAASSQAKSQFLATMSHELRTPLNAIIGFSELLKTETLGPVGDPRYAEYAADIHDSGTHLLSLINDVLDFSKAEAGRLELHEEPLDAGEVLRDCVRLVAPGAKEAGIDLTTDLPETTPILMADRRRLKQIALNLLSNAIKFTPTGGEVRVSLSMNDGGVAMTVADNGIGMSAEHIPLALEAFGQVDSSLSRRHEGTGLGLPLCRNLAEAHDATLTIESVLGEGTSVTLHFPPERIQLIEAA